MLLTTAGCDFALISGAPRIDPHICFLFLISSNYLIQKDYASRTVLYLLER